VKGEHPRGTAGSCPRPSVRPAPGPEAAGRRAGVGRGLVTALPPVSCRWPAFAVRLTETGHRGKDGPAASWERHRGAGTLEGESG